MLPVIVAFVVQVGTGAPQLTAREQAAASEHFRAGMQALMSEKLDRAEAEFYAAIKIDPLHDAAFYGLGQVYMATKRYDKAVAAYSDSRKAFIAAAETNATNKAVNDRRIRDQIQALNDYVRNLERLSPARNPTLLADIDRQKARIRQLEARLTLTPGSMPDVPAGLSMALGSAYFRMGNLPGAEREYVEAIRVDAGFGEAHNNLAVVYMLTNRLAKAEEEIALAEKAGFKVSPDLKADLKKRKGGGAPS